MQPLLRRMPSSAMLGTTVVTSPTWSRLWSTLFMWTIVYIAPDLRQRILEGGFDLRQWASNVPAVIKHLLPEAKSEHCEL